VQHLGNLSRAEGSTRLRKRLGRGPGSGTGKTAGKGHKGQKARKSGGVRPGFEGGQTPLYRRVPKRGFTNRSFQVATVIVNLSDLSRFSKDSVVSAKEFHDAGMLKGLKGHGVKIKVLGSGELSHSLKVIVDACSRSAREAIERCGGEVVLAPFSLAKKSQKRSSLGQQKSSQGFLSKDADTMLLDDSLVAQNKTSSELSRPTEATKTEKPVESEKTSAVGNGDVEATENVVDAAATASSDTDTENQSPELSPETSSEQS